MVWVVTRISCSLVILELPMERNCDVTRDATGVYWIFTGEMFQSSGGLGGHQWFGLCRESLRETPGTL